MRSKIPSTASLQCFEAAARLSSFSRAGMELNLTPTAISHQIKTLEEIVGAPLFSRGHNWVTLTSVGEEYLVSVRAALAEIAAAGDRVRHSASGDTLTVTCLATFALKALIPNLWKFQKKHPKIRLRLQTVVSFENVDRHDYDIAIRHGVGNWVQFSSMQITKDDIFPVCVPDLAAHLHVPSDMASSPGIRTGRTTYGGDLWPMWLEKAQVPHLEFASEITCDLLTTTLQAAAEGLGVAIGRTSLVRRDLDHGSLVAPFDIKIQSPSNYFATTTRGRKLNHKVRVLQEWLGTNRFSCT